MYLNKATYFLCELLPVDENNRDACHLTHQPI